MRIALPTDTTRVKMRHALPLSGHPAGVPTQLREPVLFRVLHYGPLCWSDQIRLCRRDKNIRSACSEAADGSAV